ncbi:endonuclease NucS [Halorubellus sp. PRR65]|uniref:endonuclease NucS n=2 Tax=Halobacteriales TaxID=2235 RepID=UPI002B25A9AB|nr:endonuclease NucS [Halorubellus sp. PRR65]
MPDEAVETLRTPTPTRARAFLADALRGGAYVTLVGACTVESRTRTSREHPRARRHATCKPDGTVLVHGPSGHRPLHPQPDGDRVDVRVDDDTGELVVAAGPPSGADQLVARFDTVELATAFDVDDHETDAPSGTEADLKERVLERPALVEPGLRPLATERDTPAGPVDVYAEAADGQPVVVELKRDRAGPDAVSQLARYVDALAADLHGDASPRGVLVAPGVTPRARRLLGDHGLDFAAVDPPRD